MCYNTFIRNTPGIAQGLRRIPMTVDKEAVAFMQKKAVLCALDSQYVHTNLAVYYLKSYADKHATGFCCQILEGTVNESGDRYFDKLCAERPDIVAFSAYIWNIREIKALCQRIRGEMPHVPIVLGGPEVTFNPEEYLGSGLCDYVLRGEGEIAFTTLCDAIAAGQTPPAAEGICRKTPQGVLVSEPTVCEDLAALESPYTPAYLAQLPGKIAYIEASRGCPFSCAFCLSGACRGVRFFPMEQVKRAALLLWRSGVRTVKFIDRTFNADRKRAEEILRFILENYPQEPEVCFHFEVAADRLSESLLSLLETAPKGLFQLEAGLQSFHEPTLEAVARHTDLPKLCTNVRRLLAPGNIHVHIDLIAGLPQEDYSCFRKSFNKAYALQADMLQLGFLKLLYGSALRDSTDAYAYVFDENPPYEIRATAWLTEAEMNKLHEVEDACDRLHNSGRFRQTLRYVLKATGITPFDLFHAFGKKPSLPLDAYTALAFTFFASLDGVDKAVLRDCMCRDRLSSNRSGKLPDCLKIKDSRLAAVSAKLAALPGHAPKPAMRRTVCLLYSEKTVVYADYPMTSGAKNHFDSGVSLKELPFSAFAELV